MSVLDEIETTLQEALARGPAVVGIGPGWGSGSGAVIARDRVLTTTRVLRTDTPTVVFADGERREARVLGADTDGDLAVLAVPTGEVSPLALSSAGARPGQTVIALASPGGRGLRVGIGFVASVGPSRHGSRGRRIEGAVEHSAPLPRGSAGSPLLDRSGVVLAVNVVRADGGLIVAAGGDGGLAARVEQLARGEAPRRPRLGVALAPPRAARELRRAVGLPERDGLLVRGVLDGGPADRAGVRRGDLIVACAGRPTPRVEALYEALEGAPDAPVGLQLIRGEGELAVSVELPARP
jgi:serine protease Do